MDKNFQTINSDNRAASILIVEDEGVLAMNLSERLCSMGFTVAGIAPSGVEALRITKDNNPALALMDITLRGDMDGLETAKAIAKISNMPIIFMSSIDNREELVKNLGIDSHNFLSKSALDNEIKEAINYNLNKTE